jgi:hypothetical protein
VVELLRRGQAVGAGAVEEFAARLAKAPFKEVALVLLGESPVTPCPVCEAGGSRLDLLDHVGMCYGQCGKVKLCQVLDRVYAPPGQRGEGQGARAKGPRAEGGASHAQPPTGEKDQQPGSGQGPTGPEGKLTKQG